MHYSFFKFFVTHQTMAWLVYLILGP